MYCIKCGKEIPEGAMFCPHCGSKQNGQNELKENSLLSNINHFFVSQFGKIGAKIYYLWALVNLVLLLLGGQGYEGSMFDFFDSDIEASEILFCFFIDGNGIEYYDFSEFTLYVIVVPAVIVLIKSFFKKNK